MLDEATLIEKLGELTSGRAIFFMPLSVIMDKVANHRFSFLY